MQAGTVSGKKLHALILLNSQILRGSYFQVFITCFFKFGLHTLQTAAMDGIAAAVDDEATTLLSQEEQIIAEEPFHSRYVMRIILYFDKMRANKLVQTG